MQNDDFYIGWMERSPAPFARFVRKYLLLLLLLVIAAGVLLATSQKQFRDGVFEYGKLTEVSGTYSADPVPHLLVKQGGTVFVPLVGYGKHGADGIIQQIEREQKQSLNNRQVRLQGTLIHGEGKTLLQVSENEQTLLQLSGADNNAPEQQALGAATLTGEIIDPKCYFGVMKPGEGKVHKDCAIRCIAGGIPPVLMVADGNGGRSFVLLVGANGQRLNDAAKDFVGVTSQVTGNLFRQSDWLVMHVTEMKNPLAHFTTQNAKANADCTMACCAK